MNIQFWLNISTVLGSVVGILGLLFSIKTWINTRNIKKAVQNAKLRELYPEKHKDFVETIQRLTNDIEVAIYEFNEVETDYAIITNLNLTLERIKMYYDNWERVEKNKINRLLELLKSLPNGDYINDINPNDLSKIHQMLIEILPMLERIGELNNIK